MVVTTDGSVTDISRDSYVDAEERVVEELKDINKPFIMILNSTRPSDSETLELAGELEEKYDVPVLPVDCAELKQQDILKILEQVLFEFPVNEVNISLPMWIEELDSKHWLRQNFEDAVRDTVRHVRRLRDIESAVTSLDGYDFVHQVNLKQLDMAPAQPPSIWLQGLNYSIGYWLKRLALRLKEITTCLD
ncbi:hypothetical protein N752_22505 [Desulforamulus aquiferis]|nr:hypothetical protein N752_22505 [Desulforamulus aquiferis]